MGFLGKILAMILFSILFVIFTILEKIADLLERRNPLEKARRRAVAKAKRDPYA